MFLAGCFVGAFIVSYMADILGRKKSILIGGIIFLFGGSLQVYIYLDDKRHLQIQLESTFLEESYRVWV
jgi:MFS family permease